MIPFGAVRTKHVLRALEEHERLGREAFLAQHGFGSERDYALIHNGKPYDSNAILAVAHQQATGRRLAPEDFSGGRDGAARVLRDLGFEVRGPARDGWVDAKVVGPDHARATWALAARQRLLEAAGAYHSVVTHQELAHYVQERSRISTRQMLAHGLGDVLARVTEECLSRGEPLLPSLCVDSSGHVGAGYAAMVALRGDTPDDLDDHAAHERLACHRFFRAPDLPADGGVPARPAQRSSPPSRAAASRPAPARRTATARPTAAAEKVVSEPKAAALCPVHFTEVPVSGVCDLCD